LIFPLAQSDLAGNKRQMYFILLWTNKLCNQVIYLVDIMLTVNFNTVVYVYSCE